MTITRNFSVLANGAGSANNLSLGGATLGSNALAVTGSSSFPGSTNITAAGLVGIGTTPSTLLHLYSADPELRIQGSASSSVHYSNLTFLNAAGTTLGSIGLSYYGGASEFIYNSATSWAHVWKINSVEIARFSSAGLLGIGTTSPATPLNISGSGAMIRLDGPSTTSNAQIGFTHAGVGVCSLGLDIAGGTIVVSSPANSLGIRNDMDAILFSTGGSGLEVARFDTSGNFGIGTASPGTYGKLAVNGAIAPIGTAGTYSIDVTGAALSVANNGIVAFPSSSGMLVVNDHGNGGVTIYLSGGGATYAAASVTAQVGAFAYSAGNAGYTWTNTSGATRTFGFFFVRTRPTA